MRSSLLDWIGPLRGLFLVCAVCALPLKVKAQELTYSGIDQATVRVLALGDVDLVNVKVNKKTSVKLASPIGGHGSGFLVSHDGLIVTAAHVVEDARAVAVHVPGVLGPLPAKILETDELRDFALLRIAGNYPQVAKLAKNDSSLAVRQSVFAVGYPLDATRNDPQSTRGVISGKLPDGRLQLGMSVNPGNSGGPVIDEQENVHAIVVARSNVKEGEIGLAAAVPISTVSAAIQKYMKAGVQEETLHKLESSQARKLADLVSLMAHEGPAILRGSVDLRSDSAERRKKQIIKLYKSMPDSPEATLLAAAFFWNRYVALKYDGKKYGGSLKNARNLVFHATKLDKKLKRSAFVKHVLVHTKVIKAGKRRRRKRKHSQVLPRSSTRTSSNGGIHIDMATDKGPPAVFYVHEGTASGTASSGFSSIRVSAEVYRRLCQSPCTETMSEGSYQIGLGIDNRDPVSAGDIYIDGPATLSATYDDNSVVRGGGIAVWVGSLVVGGLLVVNGVDTSCDSTSGSLDCNTDMTGLFLGGAVMIGGTIVGLIMMRTADSGTVELNSEYTGGEARHAPGTSQRMAFEVAAPIQTPSLGVGFAF